MYTDACERESRINLLYGAANAILHQRPVARDRPVSLDVTVRYLDSEEQNVSVSTERTDQLDVQDSQMDRIVSKDQQNQVAWQALTDPRPSRAEAHAWRGRCADLQGLASLAAGRTGVAPCSPSGFLRFPMDAMDRGLPSKSFSGYFFRKERSEGTDAFHLCRGADE